MVVMWFSKCDIRTGSISITLEHVRKASFQVLTQIDWIWHSDDGAQRSVFQWALQVILYENHWVSCISGKNKRTATQKWFQDIFPYRSHLFQFCKSCYGGSDRCVKYLTIDLPNSIPLSWRAQESRACRECLVS